MKSSLRMQLVLSLLTLSLVANGVLLWHETRSPGIVGSPAATRTGRATAASGPGGAADGPSAAAVSATLNWESLAPDDVRGFAASLAKAGVPAELARLIVQARLSEALALRRAALQPEATSSPYWKLPEINAELTVAKAAELRAVARENAKLLDELFGSDNSPPTLQDLAERARYGQIPSDKIEQLKMIDDDYRDLNTIYTAELRLAVLPADRERLNLLTRERENDIKALLSPEEYDAYQLRNSNVATNLRATLEAFQPSEAEFRKIFALQQAFQDRFPPPTTAAEAAAGAQQRSQAQQQLTADIKAALGPERAADYDKGTDYSYRGAQRVAQQLELPRQVGDQIYGVQKDIQARVAAVRGLPPDERIRQLTALQGEATAKITQALGGQHGIDTYRQQVSSSWLQSMVPPTTARPATP